MYLEDVLMLKKKKKKDEQARLLTHCLRIEDTGVGGYINSSL